MKEKMKAFLKKILMGEEPQGETLDFSPGLKVSRVVDTNGRKLSFNETFENILKERNLLK
jgi:hypothetical protein